MNKYYSKDIRNQQKFYHLIDKPKENTILIHEGEKLNDKQKDLNIYLKRFPIGVSLISAPTGIGKTYWARQEIMKDKYNSVLIIEPTKLIVDEVINDLTGNYGFIVSKTVVDLGLVNLSNGDKTVVVCTYHHAIKNMDSIPNLDLLLIDEAHWIHEYNFTQASQGSQNVSWEMLQLIRAFEDNTKIILLTASSLLLKSFPEWFFIRQIIFIEPSIQPVLPKKIYIYPSAGKVSVLQYVNDSFDRIIGIPSPTNKIIVFCDGGMRANPQFHNIIRTVESKFKELGLDLSRISSSKTDDKYNNPTIQSILNTNKLDVGSFIFLGTSYASTGINIHDPNVKHVIVLSDRITFIQQAAARVRSYKEINLILFQQPINEPLEDIPNIETMFKIVKSKSESIFNKYDIDDVMCGEWINNKYNELDFNPIPAFQKWFTLMERKACSVLDELEDIIRLTIGGIDSSDIVDIEVINKQYYQSDISQWVFNDLVKLTGYENIKVNSRPISNKKLAEELAMTNKGLEKPFYTQIQATKILKKENKEFIIGETVNSVYCPKSRKTKYIIL